jgi:hypothetical protein
MNIFLIVFFFVALFYLPAEAAVGVGNADQGAYPKLTMQGDVYVNSCEKSELDDMKKELQENFENWHEVSNAAEIVLCSDRNSESINSINKILPKLLRLDVGGVGEKSIVRVVKPTQKEIDTIFAERHAWGASVKKDLGDLRLQYFSDEACTKEVIFRLSEGKWRIFEIGEYCD